MYVKIFSLYWIIFLQIPDVYFQTMARYLAAKVQRAWRQSCKWQIKKLLFIMTLHAHCPKLINVCSMLHVTGSRENQYMYLPPVLVTLSNSNTAFNHMDLPVMCRYDHCPGDCCHDVIIVMYVCHIVIIATWPHTNCHTR